MLIQVNRLVFLIEAVLKNDSLLRFLQIDYLMNQRIIPSPKNTIEKPKNIRYIEISFWQYGSFPTKKITSAYTVLMSVVQQVLQDVICAFTCFKRELIRLLANIIIHSSYSHSSNNHTRGKEGTERQKSDECLFSHTVSQQFNESNLQ